MPQHPAPVPAVVVHAFCNNTAAAEVVAVAEAVAEAVSFEENVAEEVEEEVEKAVLDLRII